LERRGSLRFSLAPEGKVSVHGEFWNATSDQQVEKGAKVKVAGVDHLKLRVNKIE